MLTGIKFGPSIQTLVSIFKSLIRSQVDYGLTVYGAACKSRMKCVDVTLRSALRPILGAFKSTNVEVIFAELGIESVAYRRDWLTARYIFKLCHNPSSVAFSTARDLWFDNDLSDRKRWPKTSIPCLLNTIRSLRESNPSLFRLEPCADIGLQVSAPWSPPLTELILFPQSKRMASQHPALATQWANNLIANFPTNCVIAYTDGSFNPATKKTTAAVHIPQLDFDRTWTLTKGTGIFSAEVFAISETLDYLYKLPNQIEQIAIFSDSKAAVTAVHSQSESCSPCLAANQTIRCLRNSGTKVSLIWIPSHVGIVGNERADALAGSAAENPTSIPLHNSLSLGELYSSFKEDWQQKWLSGLKSCPKSTVQCRSSPGLIPWHFYKSRPISIVLHRLRSGHNRLGHFQNRCNEEYDPECRFGCLAIEDEAHIIIDCQMFASERAELKDYFRRKSILFNLDNVLGCNSDLDQSTQFHIRNLLAKFILSSNLASIV